MLQGISGMSSASSMPRNCGMAGMHGNPPSKQDLKTNNNVSKSSQPISNPTDLSIGIGNKIDISI